MDDLITLTRVVIPQRRADLIARPRLVAQLTELLDHRLILIAAPAGYGKSALLVDWAQQLSLQVAWYSLDPLDQDLHRFASHLVASVAQHYPAIYEALRPALAVHPLDVEALAAALVNAVYRHVPEHFVLVLDDYHLVGTNETINRLMSRLVQQASENFHLVLASRTLPVLPDLPLMISRGLVGGLDFEALAFLPSEIQTLVRQHYHQVIPLAAAEELAHETEGWITGLLLSAQTMWRGMADQMRRARTSAVGVHDYLAQQVLDQQPPTTRTFLLQTSLLEEFDAALCELVLGPANHTGDTDWPELIKTVLREQVFTVPVEREGTWVRYHHLFRDFLQTRMAQEQPESTRRILANLASVRAARGEWEAAYLLYERLEDREKVADLIEKVGSLLLRQSRVERLASWLSALPADLLLQRPALTSLLGAVRLSEGDVTQGRALLDRAITTFQLEGNEEGLSRALVRRAIAHRYLGDYDALLADAESALAYSTTTPEGFLIQAEATRMQGLGLAHTGRLEEARQALETALALYQTLGELQNVALVRMELGLAASLAGQFNRAHIYYRQALEHWRAAGDHAYQANLLNNLGVLEHQLGDYIGARSTLEEALALARVVGSHRLEALVLAGLGDLMADLEANHEAQQRYVEARVVAERAEHQSLLLYLDLANVEQARQQRRWDAAHRALNAAITRLAVRPTGTTEAQVRFARARLLLDEGDIATAINELEQATGPLEQAGQLLDAARTRLLLSRAHYEGGDLRVALVHLEQALGLSERLDSHHPLITVARTCQSLLNVASKDALLSSRVAQLQRATTRFETTLAEVRNQLFAPVTPIPTPVPTLDIRTFGRAEVLLDGQPIQEPEWHARRVVRDLLFCLLAHRDGLRREAIGLLFWPDATAAAVTVNVKNTVYRLRRALGKDVIRLDDTRYRLNPDLWEVYDVAQFEAALDAARRAPDPAARRRALTSAISLYNGPYLQEADGTWVHAERERLQQRFERAAQDLVELYLEDGAFTEALALCQRILFQEPSLEPIHRLAMRAHAALGHRAAVVNQYEQCRRALDEEVGVSPSEQTEALFATLTR